MPTKESKRDSKKISKKKDPIFKSVEQFIKKCDNSNKLTSVDKIIVVLDIETTGTDKLKDHIIQLSAIKVDTEANKVIESFNEYIRPEGNYSIAIGAYLKHHIHQDFLKDKPTFRTIGPKFLDFLKDLPILTYNGISFDLPFLAQEYKNIGIEFCPTSHKLYDAYKEELRRNSNSLSATYKRYCGKTMEESGLVAHDAFSDIKATYGIFKYQNKTDEVKDIKMLSDDNMVSTIDWEGEEKVVVTFGKYKNVPIDFIAKYDPAYINWLLSINMSKMSKNIILSVVNNDTALTGS